MSPPRCPRYWRGTDFGITLARSAEETLQALAPQGTGFGVSSPRPGLPDQDGYEICGKIRKCSISAPESSSARRRSSARSGAPVGRGPEALQRDGGQFEDILEQHRAFLADTLHQLRNPLSALLLIVLMVAVLLPLGIPLAVSVAALSSRRSSATGSTTRHASRPACLASTANNRSLRA